MMVEDYEENYITGWVKLYRSFVKWEWFEVPNMVTVFIYCLLKANHTDKRWRGIEIKRGTFITSYATMAKETNLSVKKIRTALKNLENSGELGRQSGTLNTLITINKYDIYQDFQDLEGKPNGKARAKQGQTDGKARATTNNDNNIKNEDNEKNNGFSFRKSLIDFGFDKNLVDDYLKNRKLKRLANTETAFNIFINEIEKSGLDKNKLMVKIVSNGWGGFKSSWVNKGSKSKKIPGIL